MFKRKKKKTLRYNTVSLTSGSQGEMGFAGFLPVPLSPLPAALPKYVSINLQKPDLHSIKHIYYYFETVVTTDSQPTIYSG